MSRIRRWIGSSGDAAAEPCVRAALLETFEHFAARGTKSIVHDLDTAVVLDDGTGSYWTVRLDRGRFAVSTGRAKDAETTITSDPLTLVGIVKGKRSGIEAFLRGRLSVRGNLSLALKLDGVFDRRERPSSRPRPGHVVANGIDTFYLDAGSGPPVIALHGLGATNASMLPTLWALAENHRVLAPDLPGFGDSGKPHASYDPAFYARWLASFMDAMSISEACIVGNSMGGRIAIEMGLSFPDRVSKLALLAPSMAFRRFRHAVPIVRFLSPEMGALPLPFLRSHSHQGLRLLFSRPDRLHHSWYEAAVDEFLRVFRTSRGRISLFAAARQIYLERPFGPNGFWTRLERLERPSLFVWGERDRLVPVGFAKHVEALLPHAVSEVLEDCGHVPQFELPDRTHGLIKNFLASTQSSSRARA
jgi:pimeloyl-ACP methyl ester carboxylesterase/predicted lipid carrier protein YhbT